MTNKLEGDGYNMLMSEIRGDDSEDPWGWGMGWAFALAEVACMHFFELLPGYDPGASLRGQSYKGWRQSIADDGHYGVAKVLDLVVNYSVSLTDVERVYAVLSRYLDWVRLAGRDY